MIWNVRGSGQDLDLSLVLNHAAYALDSTPIDLSLSRWGYDCGRTMID
jgi:hypothetical protein